MTTCIVLIAATVLTTEPSQATASPSENNRVVVSPTDTGAGLANPGMGWVLHFYDNVPANYGSQLAPADTVDEFPGLTVVYLRIPWSYVEPREGQFNWAVVDTPAQRWIAKGKQIAFRFSCAESWMRYATPQWVEQAGAKGYNFESGKGAKPDGPFWEPNYHDPVFLAKLDNFLAAAAARYDANPEVAFFDIGSLGVWGEGHTWHSSQQPIPTPTILKHIEMHQKHFRRALLAVNDDFAFAGVNPSYPAADVMPYAAQRGLTLRDDSILVQAGKNAYFHADYAQLFWRKVPVILECEHYGGSRDRGCWQDGSLYLKAVEDYHASYASIHWWPREFLKECRPLIDRINRRLGYRLMPTEVSWDTAVRTEASFRFAAKWKNTGVAPCLPGGHPALTFKDDQGGIVGVFTDERFDVASLPVAPPDKAETRAAEATFSLPFNLKPGKYGVFLSVGTRTGTPRIALPLPNEDGQRRYRLGSIDVVPAK